MLESSKSAVEGSYSYAQHLREIMLPPSALLTSSCSLVFNLCFLSPPHVSKGLCNRSTGKCACFKGWSSSDGAGGIGDRGDCGYRVNGTTKLNSALGLHDNPTTTYIKDMESLMRAFSKGGYKDMANIAIAQVMDHY